MPSHTHSRVCQGKPAHRASAPTQHPMRCSMGWALWLRRCLALCLIWACSQAFGQAQAGGFHIYIDAKHGQGCPVSLMDRQGSTSFSGFSHRLNVSITAAGEPGPLTLNDCDAQQGRFETASRALGVPSISPNRSSPSERQLTLAFPVDALDDTERVRLLLAASGDYLAETAPGATEQIVLPLTSNNPIASTLPAIPSIGIALLPGLASLLALSAWPWLRRRPGGAWAGTALVLLLLLIPGFHSSPGWAQRTAPERLPFKLLALATDARQDNLPDSPDIISLDGGQDGTQRGRAAGC